MQHGDAVVTQIAGLPGAAAYSADARGGGRSERRRVLECASATARERVPLFPWSTNALARARIAQMRPAPAKGSGYRDSAQALDCRSSPGDAHDRSTMAHAQRTSHDVSRKRICRYVWCRSIWRGRTVPARNSSRSRQQSNAAIVDHGPADGPYAGLRFSNRARSCCTCAESERTACRLARELRMIQ